MSSAKPLPIPSPAKAGMTIRTERSAISVPGKPRSWEITGCSSSGRIRTQAASRDWLRSGIGCAGLRCAFDDEHGLVVDQRRLAVGSEMVVLLYCVIQQGIANFPGGPAIAFSQDRFELLACLWIATVVNPVGIENKNISWTHQRDLTDIGRVEFGLPEGQRVIFLAIRVICGDLQTKRKKLHHSTLIDVHELARFRRED